MATGLLALPRVRRSRRRATWVGLILLGVLVPLAVALALTVPEAYQLLAHGETRTLRPASEARSGLTERRPDLLILAIDGVERDLLYPMLERGELPGMALLLGGQLGRDFRHAHLDRRILATMPSSTMPAWATIFTGQPPSRHGVTGNEFFIRERRMMAAPAPVSFEDPSPVLAVYTEDFADYLLEAPTIYHHIRAADPGVRIWVSMGQFHGGADRLLMARRAAMAEAFREFLDQAVAHGDARDVYAELDEEILEVVAEELDAAGPGGLPDVLTIYLPGLDLYAHHADLGPDQARRDYLIEVLDPLLADLHDQLERLGALDDRYVVLISDHGHTEVRPAARNAIGTGDDELPAAVRAAGFRIRPFALEVDEDHDFQAVIAYGGATAFIYLADRSTCPEPGQRCDFSRPPRFVEDVLPVAEALHRASRDGSGAPALAGAIDMVLTREPRPFAEDDLPFQVYVGQGALVTIDEAMAGRPYTRYVSVERRLNDLAAGRHGERAGDIMLLANNGDERHPADRFYFSTTYHSWHGSPSRKDSQVPLVVAHRKRSAAALTATVDEVLGEAPRQQAIGRLLTRLRLER
jgi:hypothetical protein